MTATGKKLCLCAKKLFGTAETQKITNRQKGHYRNNELSQVKQTKIKGHIVEYQKITQADAVFRGESACFLSKYARC